MRLDQLEPSLPGRLDDRGGEWVLAGTLKAGREPEQLVFAETVAGLDRNYTRFAFGQCAGLVDHQRIDLFETLGCGSKGSRRG